MNYQKIIKIKRSYLLERVLLIFFFSYITLFINDHSINAQTLTENNKQFFGCEIYYGQLVHCDPLLNKIESYQVKATSKKIYDTGNPTFVEGVYGKSLIFNSNTERLTIKSSPELELEEEFTINMWLKFNKLPTDERWLYGKLRSILIRTDIIDNKPAISAFVFINGTDDCGLGSNRCKQPKISYLIEETDLDRWLMLTVSYDAIKESNNFKIYKDAEIHDQITREGLIDKNNHFHAIGATASGTYSLSSIKTQMDDFRIYNKALTETEIQRIFENSEENTSNDLDIYKKVHLTFDETFDDYSGKLNHANASPSLIPSMVFAPDGRLFFTEKNTGNIRIIENEKIIEKPFVNIPNLFIAPEFGMLGLTLDPDFDENHYVYLYYTYSDSENENVFARVVRFTENNNVANEMTIIFDKIPATPHGYHIGGAMAFGPDGKLYITVGEGGGTSNKLIPDPSSIPGKVLRINKDGTIPTDNPFPNSPVYTVGHRNMFGIAFNHEENFGIITENGAQHYDEINKLQSGGNYGFPFLQPPNLPPENSEYSIKPLRSYWLVIAPTQAIYYNYDRFPQIKDTFLFNGGSSGMLYSLRFDKNNQKIIEEIQILPNHTGTRIALASSHDGSIYYSGYEIYKLDSIDPSSKKQVLFPIEINGQIKVNDIQILMNNKTMVMDLTPYTNSSKITLKIPKILIDDLSLIDAKELDLEFKVDSSSPEYNLIDITLTSDQNRTLVILGNTVIPEFTTTSFILILSVIILILFIKSMSMMNFKLGDYQLFTTRT